MKLLVVAPYFYPKVGGLENYAWNISRGLNEKYGWDIVVITSNHEGKKYKEEIIKGIKIYRLPYWFKLSNTPINFGWIFDIAKIISKEKPGSINAHTPVPFISDLSAFINLFFQIPFFLTYHNDLAKDNILDVLFFVYYNTFGAITFHSSKKIIATSTFYAEHSRYLNKYKKKIKIIPPGVNTEKYKPKNNYISKNIILFVGQLDKTHTHKGLSNLIQSMNEVVKKIPSSKLHIVGHGDNINEYKSEVKKLNLKKNILFSGYLDEKNLIKEYQNADIVVLPSTTDSEGFGMTLIEAGACGKGVIGTKVGGIPSVITDNYNGLLVKPNNIQALSKSIIQLLTNKKLSKNLGNNGYKKIHEEFSWDKQISKMHKLLIQI